MAGLAGLGAVVGARPRKAEAATAPPLPWPYATLDVELMRKRGHLNYASKHCCAGVFTTLVEALAEQVGPPFDTVPCGMMAYGSGGVAGFASLCGALNGAGAAMSLVCPQDTVKELLSELLSWYAQTPLPTEISNGYAADNAYLAKDPYTIRKPLPQSVAGGNLCHMSVSNWCAVSKLGSGSKARSERCARLTGDVAAKAAELLNAHFAGTFKQTHALPGNAHGCRQCHSKSESSHTRGKMDCMVCHVDPVVSRHHEAHRFMEMLKKSEK